MSKNMNHHEDILATKTYEDLLIFMLANMNHKMSSWFLDIYAKNLEAVPRQDDLPIKQTWLARYCDKEVHFLTRRLTPHERVLCVIHDVATSSRSSVGARSDAIKRIKAIGYSLPVDDKFALAKLACVYEDAAAYG